MTPGSVRSSAAFDAQPRPRREPAARAHRAGEALAVVADDRIAAEGEDRAQRPLRRVERRVEIARIGERPVDEQVAALQRVPRQTRALGRRRVAGRPETPPIQRASSHHSSARAIEARAARALRGTERGQELRRVARRPVLHRPIAVARIVHVEARIGRRSGPTRRRPTDRGGRAGSGPRPGARPAGRTRRPPASRSRASGTASPDGARCEPLRRRLRRLLEVEREQRSAAGVAEQHDAPEAAVAQPRDRARDVEEQRARAARRRRCSGSACAAPKKA